METRIDNINVAHDFGHEVYDTTVSARDISRMFTHGLLVLDPDAQRGKNTVTGKDIYKKDKVERWTNALLEDKAVFGQLSWNFRPGETDIAFDPESRQLIIRDGAATIPDSGHRHRAIVAAVQSITNGSSFDANRRFSLRIWNVNETEEKEVFYWMNQEGDKADATRSKWLHQKGVAQKIAASVVRTSPHLGEANIETVGNTLSVKNPRLAAFNTISTGFEEGWSDIAEDKVNEASTWFVGFWDKLTEVLPELRRVSLPERQKIRKDSMVGSAVIVHAYVRLARLFKDQGADLALLEKLDEKYTHTDGTVYDLFAWDNPLWQEHGVIVKSVDKQGNERLAVRNAHQSRRGATEAMAKVCGVTPPPAP